MSFLTMTVLFPASHPHAADRSSSGSDGKVVVYTTSQIALTHVPAGVTIISLDRLREIEAQMSKGLPANARQATLIIQQRMKTPEWLQLQSQLRDASDGVAQAKVAGIQKLPAVTVDNTYVVYGVANVTAALQQIEHARARQ
ncbi:TIGR03757 family integrating conjugative element protein [Pseudomonas sp. PA15(2017)]|uniref:TIGR03757 family integrating conjugative element protein n=1 Tax=Pseudomonas sp. PA15(2017) TaxID=1932111 RepID=UPI001439CB7A|nr:TIGR03757 family integrating conjugative element protein [Pseudomonas sp. PA15(2017)]